MPHGWKFGLAIFEDDRQAGVAIASRPVARHADDGETLEVTRLCTDGTKDACSFGYARIARAAQALGYKKLITYTTDSEPGTSLKASGFLVDAILPPRTTWSTPSRPRTGDASTQLPSGGKIRWLRPLAQRKRT